MPFLSSIPLMLHVFCVQCIFQGVPLSAFLSLGLERRQRQMPSCNQCRAILWATQQYCGDQLLDLTCRSLAHHVQLDLLK